MAGFLKQFFQPRRPTSSQIPEPAAPKHRVEQQSSTDSSEAEKKHDPYPVNENSTIAELEQAATKGPTAQNRLNAIHHLNDPEALQRVTQALKGRDKGAFQAARQKLRQRREAQEAHQSRQREIERIIADMQTHAATSDTKLYSARLEALISQWDGVSDGADADQNERYQRALEKAQSRADDFRQEEAEQQQKQAHLQEQQGAVDTLRATLDQLRSELPPEGSSRASIDAMQKTQANRWEEATRETSADEKLAVEYQRLKEELDRYIEAVKRWEEHQSEAVEALQSGNEERLTKLCEAIDWPGAYPAPQPLDQILTRCRDMRPRSGGNDQSNEEKKAHEDQEVALGKTLDDLESSLEQRHLKPSREAFRKAQKLQDQLPGKAAQHHQARITRLGRELQELRDWLGFAARPKLEALCEQMEYLAEQPMEPEAKASHIRELQQSWYDLGGTPDQQLWQRFKEAADHAYEPCHQYFSEKNRLKEANLNKRQHIVDQLQEFLENLDWSSCDYKAVDRIQRTARREWSDAKPVEFRENRPLQKQFDRLIKSINAELDRERDRNQALKADIVARAEALIEHEPLKEATESAKALQKEWEAVGITHHQEDRRLWKAFRAACDQIFARLSRQREEQEAAKGEAANQAEQMIDALDQIEAADVSPAWLREHEQQFHALSLPRDRANALRDRFDKALERVQQARLEALRQQRYQQWLKALKQHEAGETVPVESFYHPPMPLETATQESEPADQARALCIRMEIVTGSATPPEDQAQRMALQVIRMNEGLKGEQTPESQWDEIDSLLASWCELPADSELDSAHYERLREALKHWFHTETH